MLSCCNIGARPVYYNLTLSFRLFLNPIQTQFADLKEKGLLLSRCTIPKQKGMRDAHKFAVVLLTSLILFACNSAAPVADIPTMATEPPATLEPSTTPEPSLTATEAALQLEVVDSYQWDYSASGDPNFATTYIAARVRNPYDFAVDIHGLATVLLLDSAGETALRTEGATTFEGSFLGLEQIMPGETIGILFCACYGSRTVEWETWKLDFDLREIEPIPVSRDVDINVDGFVFSNQFGIADAVHGTLRYTGDQPLRGIWVRYFVYDEAGKFVSAGALALLGDRIQGGYANINTGDTFDLLQGIIVDQSLSDQNLRVEVTAIGIIADQ